MIATKKSTEMADVQINVKLKLATLWVALMFLYVYADILSFYRPGHIEEITAGMMGPFPVTQAGLLSAAILMAIPSVMVFLSLALPAGVNRWTNLLCGVLYTLVNISNLIGESWAYYITTGVVEIVLTLLIMGYAWQWPKSATVADDNLA